MKKIKLIFAFLCLGMFFQVFANGSDMKIHFGIGTAAISYGDTETKEVVANLLADDFTRLILSSELGVSLKLDKAIRFIAGGNIVYDSFLKGSQSAFYLDYAFFGGLRVYPGLGGFNLGLEYNTGRRANIYNLSDYSVSESYSTNWGNGFRFVAEYDFSYYTEGLAPVVGFSYRRMPRGGFADNFFTFYFRLAY